MGANPSRPDEGTVYVAMHSIRGGGVGPGNYLTDVANGTSRLASGTTIVVAGNTYRATGSEIVTKRALASTGDLWEHTPNRLIVITCPQQPNGQPSTRSLVITASTTQ